MNDIIKDESLYSVIEKDFLKHLEIPDNNRIIFSAKFGKGKTTFLKEFFTHQSPELKKKYNFFHLFPVNYSVATNEDIFRFLKYDILIEFLRKELNYEVFDFTLLNKIEWFIYRNSQKILANILSFIPKVGHSLEILKNSYDKIKPEFDKWEKSIESKFEGNALTKYLDEIEGDEGSIYENDFITKIIENTLSKLKNSDPEKVENILLIDDLDRIDPEHIFRILNIFAAHFDENLYSAKGKLNKFGFDKIIIVCDYDNFKSIFHHKYGVSTDFAGYINKFYSKKPFEVKNLIEEFCRQTLNTLIFKPYDENYFLRTGGTISFDIFPIINGLYKYNYISLRSIKSIKNINFNNNYTSPNIDGIQFDTKGYSIHIQLNILKFLCGDLDSLFAGLITLKKEKYPIEYIERSAATLIYFNTAINHQFGQSKNNIVYTYYCDDFSININNPQVEQNFVQMGLNGREIKVEEYYSIILDTCKKLKISNCFH